MKLLQVNRKTWRVYSKALHFALSLFCLLTFESATGSRRQGFSTILKHFRSGLGNTFRQKSRSEIRLLNVNATTRASDLDDNIYIKLRRHFQTFVVMHTSRNPEAFVQSIKDDLGELRQKLQAFKEDVNYLSNSLGDLMSMPPLEANDQKLKRSEKDRSSPSAAGQVQIYNYESLRDEKQESMSETLKFDETTLAMMVLVVVASCRLHQCLLDNRSINTASAEQIHWLLRFNEELRVSLETAVNEKHESDNLCYETQLKAQHVMETTKSEYEEKLQTTVSTVVEDLKEKYTQILVEKQKDCQHVIDSVQQDREQELQYSIATTKQEAHKEYERQVLKSKLENQQVVEIIRTKYEKEIATWKEQMEIVKIKQLHLLVMHSSSLRELRELKLRYSNDELNTSIFEWRRVKWIIDSSNNLVFMMQELAGETMNSAKRTFHVFFILLFQKLWTIDDLHLIFIAQTILQVCKCNGKSVFTIVAWNLYMLSKRLIGNKLYIVFHQFQSFSLHMYLYYLGGSFSRQLPERELLGCLIESCGPEQRTATISRYNTILVCVVVCYITFLIGFYRLVTRRLYVAQYTMSSDDFMTMLPFESEQKLTESHMKTSDDLQRPHSVEVPCADFLFQSFVPSTLSVSSSGDSVAQEDSLFRHPKSTGTVTYDTDYSSEIRQLRVLLAREKRKAALVERLKACHTSLKLCFNSISSAPSPRISSQQQQQQG